MSEHWLSLVLASSDLAYTTGTKYLGITLTVNCTQVSIAEVELGLYCCFNAMYSKAKCGKFECMCIQFCSRFAFHLWCTA